MSMELDTSCSVCFTEYDAIERLPKILFCGHTTCAQCLKTMATHEGPFAKCPICRKVTSKPSKTLPVNYQLLQVLNKFGLLDNTTSSSKSVATVLESCDNRDEELRPDEYQDRMTSSLLLVEDELEELKNRIRALGLDFEHCFPNAADEQKWEDHGSYGEIFCLFEDNTLSTIHNCASAMRSIMMMMISHINKARLQRELIEEQINNGSASILEGGRVKLSKTRPNGEELPDGDLLASCTCDQPPEEYDPRFEDFHLPGHDWLSSLNDEDEWSFARRMLGYEGSIYSDDSGPYFYPDDDVVDVSPSGSIVEQLDQSRNPAPRNYWSRRCELCNCAIPAGERALATHEAGRMHQRNLAHTQDPERGWPPQIPNVQILNDPFQPIGPPRGRSRRGRGRGRGRRGRGWSPNYNYNATYTY